MVSWGVVALRAADDLYAGGKLDMAMRRCARQRDDLAGEAGAIEAGKGVVFR